MARAVVVSDSQSTPQTVQNCFLWHRWLLYVVSSELKEIIWMCCPGCAGGGVSGRADGLVFGAPIGGALEISVADMLRIMQDNVVGIEMAIGDIARGGLLEWRTDYGTSSSHQQ